MIIGSYMVAPGQLAQFQKRAELGVAWSESHRALLAHNTVRFHVIGSSNASAVVFPRARSLNGHQRGK